MRSNILQITQKRMASVITKQQLEKKIQTQKFLLVDVRQPEETISKAMPLLPYAVNIPRMI